MTVKPLNSHSARYDAYVFRAPDAEASVLWPQPFDGLTLSRALGIEHQLLWYLVCTRGKQYSRREIPKKSGGVRTLHIPQDGLAFVQRRILRTFLDNYDWAPHVSAYVLGRGPRQAAEVHAGRPFLAVVDLKDFFPSVKQAWVRDAFERQMHLSPETARLLAVLTTAPWYPEVKARYRVPQGAPTSGAVANLVAQDRLDPAIQEVCARYDMTYTRYADDLAFSCPTYVGVGRADKFLREIIHTIKQAGFYVNYDKIRVQRQNQQQRLLGLTVNHHPNIPRKDYRRMRALAHQCRNKGYAAVAAEWGYESAEAVENYLKGVISYYEGVAPAKAEVLRKYVNGIPA